MSEISETSKVSLTDPKQLDQRLQDLKIQKPSDAIMGQLQDLANTIVGQMAIVEKFRNNARDAFEALPASNTSSMLQKEEHRAERDAFAMRYVDLWRVLMRVKEEIKTYG